MYMRTRWIPFSLLLVVCCLGLIAPQQPTATTQAVAQCDVYGSLPKGVVVEGAATGFEPIQQIQYLQSRKGFRVNDSFYPSPVSHETLYAIAMALQEDDRIGVSILDNERAMVYGKIAKEGPVAKPLLAADRVLGAVIFGRNNELGGIKLPGGYQPKQAMHRQIGAICNILFAGYVFEKVDGVYRRKTLTMQVLLIPMSNDRSKDGGYLPAMDKMGLLADADKENAAHIRANLSGYLHLKVFSDAAAIGEAAAFIRMMRDQYKIEPKRIAAQVYPTRK